MKKILLINPTLPDRVFTFNEPIGLGIVAALTPENYDIELIDENFEAFRFIKCDIVAITATTASVNRAYEISKIYNDLNIPTVIGGIHASLKPDEAGLYFTSVVIGDAELCWKEVIKDFENNALKKYYGSKNISLKTRSIVVPRRDIFSKYNYPASTIETSRGCPFNCDYCSIVSFYGKTFFERPENELIEELKVLKNKLVFFSDDNFIGKISNKERLIRILNAMIPLNIKWYAFASANVIKYPDMLKLLQKSGCVMLHIGFESDELSAMNEVNKTTNYDIFNKYSIKNCVDILHKYKISVMGSFIFGFDSDTLESMKLRLKRIEQSGIDWFSINILTPLPGSALFNRFLDNNRILFNNYPYDWQFYNYTKTLYTPKQFTNSELDVFFENAITLFNTKKTYMRMVFSIFKLRSICKTYYLYVWIINHWKEVNNYRYVKMFLRFFKKRCE